MERPLYIGQIAKNTGISQKTLRYYEELGLIPLPMRTKSGYRIYNPNIQERLAFIKKAQSLGLKLSEIKQILDIYNQGQTPCSHIQRIISQKISEMDSQIRDLLTLQQDLRKLLYRWEFADEETCGGEAICPRIQSYSPTSSPEQPQTINLRKKGGENR
jgi:DNA-binding transcriptional MerR regulator